MERTPTSLSAAAGITVLIILHVVGLAGFALPAWVGIFRALVPIHLLLSVVILMGFHQHWSLIFLINSLGIAAGGWFIEFIGVHSKSLFGNYQYTAVLGPSLGGVPLIMALNWLMLIYAVGSVVQRLQVKLIWQVLIGGFIMVFLDFALENFAMAHNLWEWNNNTVPALNYATWFVVSCLFLGRLLTTSKLSDNPIALPLLLLQLIFFYGGWLANIW
jgi:putative membrane protein